MVKSAEVAIIGGGAAGLSLAVELARQGIQVCLIEREERPGGHAAGFICKATDKCRHCLACRVHQLLAGAREYSAIRWLNGTEAQTVQKSEDGYTILVKQSDEKREITVNAVVLAVGFTVFNPRRRGEYGYGVYPGVITGAELEGALAGAGLPAHLERIGFIQCVGSRDTVLGRGYCSQVCCQTSIRQAGLLRSRFPEAEINIFYLDLQAPPELKAVCQDQKINLIRGLPSRVYNRADGRLGLRLDPALAAQTVPEPYDLIVLACAMAPATGLSKLARGCGWPLNEYGFLARPDSWQGPLPGTFAVGAGLGPKGIGRSLAEGVAAANEIIKWLNIK